MHLSSEDYVAYTFAGRLEGVLFVIVVVRWLRETSLCEDILVVRVARKRTLFDAAHTFVQVATSSTRLACIFIMGVRSAFFECFVLRPVYLAPVAVGEGGATLSRQAKFEWRQVLRHETTYTTRDKIHWREPRITNAIIECIVFCAPSRHWYLGADAVVLF